MTILPPHKTGVIDTHLQGTFLGSGNVMTAPHNQGTSHIAAHRARWQGRGFRTSKYCRSNRISSQAIKGMIFETSSQRELRRCSRCIASLAETCAYDLQRGCLGKASMRAFRPGSEISENAFTSDPLNTVMKTFHDSCHSTMRSATSLFEKGSCVKDLSRASRRLPIVLS